ncbi:EIF3A (predicted), partial [Pycnogonum litorale]
KKQRALDALYDVIKSKKHKTWQKIHEPIMNQYLVLCVDLKKSHIAKEGLFQYRNICQQMNIKSLEDVVRGYLKLAEDKTDEARQQSQQAVVDIDDLDQITTPENMLLSAVSGEDSQDRTDRVVLIPWVKFLWESYRQCLELLRNNSRVERLYHDIAQQAFKFCLNYTRKTEFRKLCDNLRAHLGQIQKHQHQQTAINLNNPESQAMHLETRLVQLDSSITMELWQEAYKAIEDIHGLMALSKKSPKPQLMANYYQKLALVFWKAGNHLFHAAALFRLFSLSREMKKNLTPDDLQKMATRVTMATLAVPLPPARSEVDRFLETDESVVEKNRKLAALLGLTNPPTRMSLVKDLIRQNVLPYAMTQIQELHKWLEIEFHPLDLCDRIDVCLKELEKNEELVELQHYIPAVQKISVMRLLFQVSQVYQSIEFNRLLKLAPFISQFQLESLIVDAVRRNDLQVIIDHKNESLHFGHNLQMTEQSVQGGCNIQSMPGEAIRNQLVQMCDVLTNVVFTIQPGQKQQKNEEIRQRVVTAYKNTADKEHKNILQRRLIIEKRKEYLENQNIQREEEERHQQEITRRNQQMAETERLKREAEERDRQRRLLEIKEVQKKQVKDRIEQLKKSDLGARIFQDIDEEELENLDADTIMAKQVEQLDKERKELQTRLKSQEKKIDYMERAKRLAEIPFIQNAYKEFLIKDQESWEQQESERVSEAIRDRQVALQTSERLMLLRDDKEKFLNKLKSDRGVFYNTKLSQFEETLETKREIRLQERKEKRKTDRR